MTSKLTMFKSATLKLTAWYVFILVTISLLFSVVIYTIASSEFDNRISSLQQSVRSAYDIHNLTAYDSISSDQISKAQSSFIASLIITNLCIWVIGGVGSYYLAKRTLRPIEQAHEAQSRFSSDASHELRTPLASMKIELEVALRDKSITKSEMREVLASSLEEVNKLTKLSHTLLQLSRLENDRIVRERVNVAASTRTAVNRFTSSSRVKISGPSVYVQANQPNVEELVTILVDNALKYSPAGSTVELVLFKQKQMAGFKIINGGEGIDSAALPYIFNRFYRTDRSRTSTGDTSYGLGLSLAKSIVQLHSGELTVSSAKNAETTFTVLLPLAPTPKKTLKKTVNKTRK